MLQTLFGIFVVQIPSVLGGITGYDGGYEERSRHTHTLFDFCSLHLYPDPR